MRPTKIDFNGTPLTDVIERLKDYHKIEIQLDRKALEEAGIGLDINVTRKLKENSLKAALRQFLDEGTFTFLIDHESLLITTTDAAASRLYVTLYPVADLLDRYRDEKGNVWSDFEPLADKIRSTVQPKTWADAGGAGSLARCTPGGTAVLVIAQTQQVQEEVAALLAKLRKAKPSGGRQQGLRAEQLPVKPRPAPAPRKESPDNEGGRAARRGRRRRDVPLRADGRPACCPGQRGPYAGLGAGAGRRPDHDRSPADEENSLGVEGGCGGPAGGVAGCIGRHARRRRRRTRAARRPRSSPVRRRRRSRPR